MKDYPDWVFAIIILLCVVPVLSIPLMALAALIRSRMRKSPTLDHTTYKNEAFEIETPTVYTTRD